MQEILPELNSENLVGLVGARPVSRATNIVVWTAYRPCQRRARTVAGLDAARACGRTGGRPSVMTPDKRSAADELMRRPGATVAAVARALGVSRPALHRYLASSNATDR